jgi:hypothetical protein
MRSVNGRNVDGIWSDRTHCIRKCVGSVGNFDQSANTDHSIFFYLDLRKQTYQTMPNGSRERYAAAWNSIITGSRRSEMRRTIGSIRHDFPNARPVRRRSVPLGLIALSERTHTCLRGKLCNNSTCDITEMWRLGFTSAERLYESRPVYYTPPSMRLIRHFRMSNMR